MRLLARPIARLAPPLVAMVATGCAGGGGSQPSPPPVRPDMRVAVAGVRPGATLPREVTCSGRGRSPAVRWSAPPPGTRELALLVTDPDAPSGTFTHWTVWYVDPAARGTPPGAPPPGARQGRNSAGAVGYAPPCPPSGDPPHRYVFTVYALRRPLGLPAGASPAAVVRALRGRAVAEGRTVARFSRP